MPIAQSSAASHPSHPLPATRAAGLARLTAFLPRAGRAYAARRNYDLGPADRANVSGLSPYVRHRLVTEAEVVDAALARHGPVAAAKFVDEVCWRTYWKGWLEQRPAVWDRYLADLAALRAQLAADRDLDARYRRALAAETGIAPFDAWIAALGETGYLHNHARMWFASLWTHTLRLPWQLGADHFLRHLIDGDPASNTLSWRWVVGLHTPGKTYLARADNIARYTHERFRAIAGLAEVGEPESEPPLPRPGRLRELTSNVPPGPLTLLVTEDDLTPEQWRVPPERVTDIVLLDTTAAWDGLGPAVIAFRQAALADARNRAERHFGRPATILVLPTAEATGAPAAPDDSSTFVTAELPIGPTRTAVASWLASSPHAPPLHELRRPWDTAFWPYARAGFFKLRERIPTALAGLGLPTGAGDGQAPFDFGTGEP